MMFFAGAACCCIVLCAVLCYFSFLTTTDAVHTYVGLKQIADRAMGKDSEMVLSELKNHYRASHVAAGDAVLVYQTGTATITVPNRETVLIGLGVDENSIVREVNWSEDFPASLRAKRIIKYSLL